MHTNRRSSVWTAVPAACAVIAMLGLARDAYCSSYWMTPQYSTYSNFSTDGTYIYTSVTVDGYTSGTCPTQPAYLANQCHSTTHTPKLYNMTGNTGGWVTGPAVYWSSYLSDTNSQQIAATPGTEYSASLTGEVICSFVGGAIYSSGSSVSVKIAVTTYKYQSVSGGICTYVVFCGANQYTCGQPTLTTTAPCPHQYIVTEALAVRIGNTTTCFAGPGQGTDVPATCQ